MLTVLLPVTRAWSMDAVVASIAASDIPRRSLVLILDAPGCEAWEPALAALGFDVTVHATGNGHPPRDRKARRARHREMRLLSQTLIPKSGALLCLEDDTLVPRDVWRRLVAAGPHATGVQVGRHTDREQVGVYGALKGHGVEVAKSCGHYCLKTTCEAYRAAEIPVQGAIDTGHTAQLPSLTVDWDCVCGHLLKGGEVLMPKVTARRDGTGPLELGALVHMYPPMHNAGAEHMLHAILSEAVRRVHPCRVVVHQGRCAPLGFKAYTVDGVSVSEDMADLEGCDVVLTHLDRTPDAEAWCEARRVPCVHIIHNHLRPKMARRCDLAVYNSEWIRSGYRCTGSPMSVVAHPPVWPETYRVEPRGEAVTLINLSEAKGAKLFYALAEAMPEVEFLGVLGAYGEQIEPPRLPNLTIMENQADVRRVYERTRVLLMPSSYESYGRCAVEAAVSGIPCIAHRTEGLAEALGPSGVLLRSMDVATWKAAIEDVLDDWAAHSERSARHASGLDPAYDVARILGAIEATCSRPIGPPMLSTKTVVGKR